METPENDPVTAYLKTKQRPADGADPVAAYLATKEKAARPTPTGHNGVPFVDAKPEDASIGDKVLGTIAAVDRDIPGAEMAQAKVRSLVRGIPYQQALDDIRGAEDAAPALATGAARLAGSGLSLAVLPGGAVAKGALYGGLSGLGNAEEQSSNERAARTVGGAVIGGIGGYAAGKAGNLAGRVARPLMTLGKRAASGVADAAESLGQTTGEATLPPEVLRGDSGFPPDRHRTAAQFAEFARRMANRAAPNVPTVPTEEAGNTLEDLLARSVEMAKAKRVP